MIKVLLVEDEVSLAIIIKKTLSTQGFDITTAYNGEEGLSKVMEINPDLMVVDVMMPRMDGFEMVRRLRNSHCNIPVLFLTARSTIDDVVEGFELGGDDYLKKPFDIKELIVRLKALNQRTAKKEVSGEPAESDSILQIGQYTFNPVKQTLSRYGETENLSSRETRVLQMLASDRNHVVETHDILTRLWGNDSIYNSNSLQVFITKLRRKLAKDSHIRIVNARGIGYKLLF